MAHGSKLPGKLCAHYVQVVINYLRSRQTHPQTTLSRMTLTAALSKYCIFSYRSPRVLFVEMISTSGLYQRLDLQATATCYIWLARCFFLADSRGQSCVTGWLWQKCNMADQNGLEGLGYTVHQGSQTHGPWAACGLQNYFVQPSAMSTNLKIFWIKTTCIIHFSRKNIIRLRPLLTYIYCAFPLTRE